MYPPKRVQFRKQQKGTIGGTQSNASCLHFGRYAIVSLDSARLRASTIEAVRRVITRKLKRSGQVWVCVHPSLSVSAKPLEVRMGKGKGSLSYWACRIKSGEILYEIDGVDRCRAKQAHHLADSKLPVKTTFLSLNDVVA